MSSMSLIAFLVLAATLCSKLNAVMDVADEMGVEQITSELESNGTTGEVPVGRTLFLLHLLKQKLNKLHQFNRIPTTAVAPFRGCLCVPFYLCDVNNTIINDGSGVIDIRYRQCTGDLEVCCFLRASTAVVPITRPATATVPTTTMMTLMTTLTTTRVTPMTLPTTVMTTTTTRAPPVTLATTQPTTLPTTQPTTLPTSTTTRRTPMTLATTAPTMRPTVTIPTTAAPIVSTSQPIVFCTCVPVYQCALYGGGGNVDGTGIINPRQQLVNTCIGAFVCCNYASAQATVQATISSTFPPFVLPVPVTTAAPVATLPPIVIGQSCVCTLASACNIGYFPIAGVGNIDPRLILARQGQPAGVCPIPNSICCPLAQSSNNAVISQTSVASNNILPVDIRNPGTANACSCVPADRCTEGNAVTYDGIGAIDPRFGPCSSASLVCCRLSNRQRADIIVSSATMTAACGLRDTTYASSTQLAGTAYFAEFPWMTLLLIRKAGTSDIFQCGGSLVNSRTVLTAAHCVVSCDPGSLIARVGEWNTQNTNEPLAFQEVYAQQIIVHPQFFGGGLYHDVALVILSQPVTYAINVRPACLPMQGQVFPAGTVCYASGWGRSAFGEGGSYQTILRKVDLPVIDNNVCQSRLRATRLGQFFQLHPSFICAGGEASKDTCYKDGGGPLVCQDQSGRFTQAGIVSWGIGCGSNTPAVYANVAQHRHWIDQTLLLYGINS